jgi:hypothetical protein
MLQITFLIIAKKDIEGTVIVFSQQNKEKLALKLQEIYGGTEGFAQTHSKSEETKVMILRAEAIMVFLINPPELVGG